MPRSPGLPRPDDKYLYPNASSYSKGLLPNRRKLRKGMIFSLRTRLINAGGSIPTMGMDMSSAKEFQFNPANLDIGFAFVPVNAEGTEAPGGADRGAGTGGLGKTSLQLFFNRELEVAKATGGTQIDESGNFAGTEDFARYGVQRDIYDLLAILLEPNSGVLPRDNLRLGPTYDIASAGSQASAGSAPVGIMFNEDFVLYGQSTEFSINYVKFSHNLVPTWAYVNLSMEVFNIGNVSSILADWGQGGTRRPLVGGRSSVDNPGGTTNPGSVVIGPGGVVAYPMPPQATRPPSTTPTKEVWVW